MWYVHAPSLPPQSACHLSAEISRQYSLQSLYARKSFHASLIMWRRSFLLQSGRRVTLQTLKRLHCSDYLQILPSMKYRILITFLQIVKRTSPSAVKYHWCKKLLSLWDDKLRHRLFLRGNLCKRPNFWSVRMLCHMTWNLTLYFWFSHSLCS